LLVDDHLIAESDAVRLVSTAVLVDRATRRVSRPEHGFRSPSDVVNADATDQPPRPERIEVRAVLLVRGAARFSRTMRSRVIRQRLVPRTCSTR
jgi:hypothetical protein